MAIRRSAHGVWRSSIQRRLCSASHPIPLESGSRQGMAVARGPVAFRWSRKAHGRVVIRASSSGITTCSERSIGLSPWLLSSHWARLRLLLSSCNTGRSRRSQSGLPKPACSAWTEAKDVPAMTSSARCCRSRSCTPAWTAGSRKLLTQSRQGRSPCLRRASFKASARARSPA